MRIEPPPSLACAIGTTPEATRAAAPPEEAPGECEGFQGLRTGWAVANSVEALRPNSGSRVLPSTARPVARNWSVNRALRRAGRGRNASLPRAVGRPRRSTLSLRKVGTPQSGPPMPSRLICGLSYEAWATGSSVPSTRAARATTAPTSSRGLTAPARTRAARATASYGPRASSVNAWTRSSVIRTPHSLPDGGPPDRQTGW